MRTLGFLATILVVFAMATARGAVGVPIPHVAQEQDTPTLYRTKCQMCHGPSGKSRVRNMAFVGRTWKYGTASADMAKVIADGVEGTSMMSFKGKLSAEEIMALARHVRAFDTTLPPEK